jgi:hypothetical protein
MRNKAGLVRRNLLISVSSTGVVYLHRIIHKSVKHFKNSQQIGYATDRGNSYADRERNSPSFLDIISQMLDLSIHLSMR